MPYTHFGKQADVWKHIALSQIIQELQPEVYIEANSASASYLLNRTPEQEYGIYHFLSKASENQCLGDSVYFQIEEESVAYKYYIGSPGLAMRILKNNTKNFLFFDIEPETLDTIREFAEKEGIDSRLKTFCQDSIEGLFGLLPDLPINTFIHIDPYEIDVPNVNGHTYLDLFLEASRVGMQCFLWYGFNTLDEKERLNHLIRETTKNNNIHSAYCVDLTLNIIQKDIVLCNPGIIGSGLLVSNLSESAKKYIFDYAEALTGIYENSKYKDYQGDLYYDIVLS